MPEILDKFDDWKRYRVGPPSTNPNFVEPSCKPFDIVYHISHIDSALSIVNSNIVRSGIVYDDSKLNKSRIHVAWMSPNTWRQGSIYGTISFAIDWNIIIKEKNCYWIGVMEYGVHACRILISDKDYSHIFPKYDPSQGDGPWWYNETTDTHYRNGNINLEIMLEESLELSKFEKLSFVKHRKDVCCNNLSLCPDVKMEPELAGAMFLSGVAGKTQISRISHLLKPSDPLTRSTLINAWDEILIAAKNWNYSGGIVNTSTNSSAISRSFLASFGNYQLPDAEHLACLFSSFDEFLTCTAELIERELSITSPILRRNWP